MKKTFKRVVSTALAVSMLFTSAVTKTAFAADFSAVGGWYETIYAELNADASSITSVSYSGPTSGTLSDYDMANLVRSNGSGKTRIDIPGLAAGDYTLTVKSGGTTYTGSNIKVYKNDRSGYAHTDAKKESINGIGAYKDDGTLKDNAVVLYVTEANKNTLTIDNCSKITKSPKGIGNILNYKSDDANGTTGGGKDDVLKILAENNIPLVVRVVGTVKAGDDNTRSDSVTNINGLTAYNSTGNGGTVKDNGMIARMFNAQNVTVEGIGTDAVIDGWGFQVISGTARPAKSVEFRNLTFKNTPEDAIGLEGTVSKSKNPQSKEWLESSGSPIKFCWVHNCTFEHGYCKNPAESDKAEGDGSLDFKRGYGFTQDYNHYIENHKTNLIGSSSDSIQYDITYHHNFYDQVWSRQPLVRQANVHIYNSYFRNGSGTSYIISPRANSYTFSEANFYDGCKNPIDSPTEGAGYVKSYNDNFAGCFGNNYATIASEKNQAVSGNTNPYKNDFDGAFPYDYSESLTDSVQAKADCIAKAGVMKAPSAINMSPAKVSMVSEYPPGYLELPYTLDLSDNYAAGKNIVGNAILNAASKSSGGSVKIRANGLIFMINQRSTVTFTSGSSSAYGMELVDEFGMKKATIAKSGQTSVIVDAGVYVLQSGNSAKDAYLEAFNVKAVSGSQVVTVETQTQPTTQSVTVKPSGEQTTKPQQTTEAEQEDVNSDITGDGYIWNYTTGENTNNFFNVSGNDYFGAKVTYKGATLTKALKMESSTDINFDAGTDGTFYIYTYSTQAKPTIKINDNAESVSANGITSFDIGSGQTVYVSKGTTSTYVYFMQFVPKSAANVTTEAATQTTVEKTTETTTVTATTAKPVSESTSETTTQAPAGSVNIYGETVNAAVGSRKSLPIKAKSSSDKNIGGYVVALSYDSGLEFENAVDRSSNGQLVYFEDKNAAVIAYVGDVSSNGTLFDVDFTASKTGSFPVKVIVQELIDTDAANLLYSANNGAFNATVASNGSGDVYKDNVVNETDAAYLLKYISGISISDSKFDITEGNCDGEGDVPDMLDVIWILNNQRSITVESSSETTTQAVVNDSGIAAGSYSVSDLYKIYTDKNNSYVENSNVQGFSSSELKVRTNKGIYIIPGITGTMTITWSNKIPRVSLDGNAVEGNSTSSPTSYQVQAGKKYLIDGSTDSNTYITKIEFK